MISKEMIKLKEQTEKLFNSEAMKKLFQNDKAMYEQMQESGSLARIGELTKQIVAVAPQLFHVSKVQQVPAIEPEPEPEPKTDKEIYLETKDLLRKIISEYHGEHFDFETQWECADEMRYRTDEGEYDTYMDAYRFAVKHYTVNGKEIKSTERLVKAYKRAKDSCYQLKSQPDNYWNK